MGLTPQGNVEAKKEHKNGASFAKGISVSAGVVYHLKKHTACRALKRRTLTLKEKLSHRILQTASPIRKAK